MTPLLATIEEANRRYGSRLLPALAVVVALVWLANRPVRPRSTVAGPGLWAGLAGLVAARLAARLGAHLADEQAGPGVDAPPLGPAHPWRHGRRGAGRALTAGAGRLAMPAPRQAHSALYDDYIKGSGHSPYTRLTWTQTKERLWPQQRAAFGAGCQLGLVCAGRAPATELDHCAQAAGWPNDYARLGRETIHDTAGVCHDCHVRRTVLQRQHVNAWLLPQALRKFPGRLRS